MEEKKLKELMKQREQLLQLREDESLLTGITLNTMAGDIRITKRGTILSLIDHLIKDIQDQINYAL